MKRAADEQKERQEMIREQKKQVSNMPSNIERITDFLERLTKNQNVPKALIEDIKWAIKTLSSNKLFKSKMGGFKVSKDREDAKAWHNLINLPSSLIINKNEGGYIDAFTTDNNYAKGINRNDSNLLKRSNTPVGLNKYEGSSDKLMKKQTRNHQKNQNSQEEIHPFFDIIEETDTRIYENVLKKFDETQFDSFEFSQIMGEKSFQFLMYEIFSIYNIMTPFNIPIRKLCDFAGKMQRGYSEENEYHCPAHIVDTLQAMHYLYYTANLKRFLKKGDILASFL